MLERGATAGRQEPGPSRTVAEEDVRLIARIVRRDLRAFESLYRSYHPRLSRFLGAMVRRPELVEEVLNDTMVVVWNQPGKFNGASKVSTWIFAIAYRKALKALRRNDEPVDDPMAEERPSAEPGPEQLLAHHQLRQVLGQAMERLSAAHRAVVDLTYFHGLGYREIAEIMACPVDTVKTRMFHARRQLRSMLAGGPGEWL